MLKVDDETEKRALEAVGDVGMVENCIVALLRVFREVKELTLVGAESACGLLRGKIVGVGPL